MLTSEIGNIFTEGTMIQVIAYGAENPFLTRKNMATNYLVSNNNGNKIKLDRMADLMEPEYLVFKFNDNNILNDTTRINEILNKINISYCLGETKIFNVKMRFLLNLENYEIVDNELYVNLHFNIFFNPINQVGLQNHTVYYVLDGIENNFESIHILSKGTYLDTDERRNLVQLSFSSIMQTIDSIQFNNVNQNVFRKKIVFNGVSKGLFIECDNINHINHINHINNITLSLNGYNRLSYNRFLIKKKCVKITDKLLYLPMNSGTNWKERTKESFDGAINFSRINTIILQINFDSNISQVTIYNIYGNEFRQVGGMGGTAFSHSIDPFKIEKYHNENIMITNIINNNINIYKPIENDKNICNISHEEIEMGIKYMSCDSCQNNYIAEHLKRWFRTNSSRPCPTCRVRWSDDTEYINSNPPIST